MARRTKRPRVVWLPPNDSANVGANQTNGVHELILDNAGGPAGNTVVGEIPLTIDGQFDAQDPNTSLSDMFNSGYRLRRIVGKIFVEQQQQTTVAGAFAILVTAGIIVRREDPTTGASMASAFSVRDTSPVELENYSDPWIWRRSWILFDNTGNQGDDADGPTSNYFAYGSGIHDGPHVDQKTARIIGPEERLFLDVSSMILIAGTDTQILATTRVWADLRILASLRTSTGNRRNASR